MIDALLVSHVILWLVVLVLCAAVVALVRQIGVLHQRIAPAGALMLGQGPKVGEEVPLFELQALDGDKIRLGGAHPTRKSTLVFFLSPTCPVCKTLLPVLRSSRKSERKWLDIVLASDGDLQEQYRFVQHHGLSDFPYVVSTELGIAFQVGKLPYAVIIDDNGVLRARGLVNSREHLESMFEAKERGVASLQEYLERESQEQNVA